MPPFAKCPGCKTVYPVPKESHGTHKQCDQCGTTFTVELHMDETVTFSGSKPPAQPAPSVPAAEKKTPAKTKRSTLGHYVLKRKLGEGGMGEVYLAHDPNLDRYVAIKVLPAAFSANKEHVERFLREARSAAKLHHTNVTRVYQIGTEGKLIYIAMEYVEGQGLDKSVAVHGPMNWHEATNVIRDAATGLAAAHELGLVHRDIKPSNLMRTASGETKVIDFGLARAVSSHSNITQQGRILGTPAYMSPEQWMGKETDARSDLYSLICTYYYLLTGEEPFEADSMTALGYQHRYSPFPDARKSVANLPAAVCQVLARGSKKEPSQRYQTAKQLIAALNGLEFSALAESDGFEAAPASRTKTRPLTQLKPVAPRSHFHVPGWATIGAVAIGVILLLGIIIHVAASSRSQAPAIGTGSEPKQIAAQHRPKPPPPASVPSDAEQAKERQRAWARDHGIPLEATNSIGMKTVLIPPGEFMMGSAENEDDAVPNEYPRHRVRITKPFYMGVYDVTQEQYERVMGTNPSAFSANGQGKKVVADQSTGHFPVENVSWEEAATFCRKLSETADERAANREYRLPTEAQWEYACRAATASRYYHGNDVLGLNRYAWYRSNANSIIHPVGEKEPNPWGLYDMNGNVCQWCSDWFDSSYYGQSPVDDPEGSPLPHSQRARRGGNWNSCASYCRSANRGCNDPRGRFSDLGFRIVQVLAEAPEKTSLGNSGDTPSPHPDYDAPAERYHAKRVATNAARPSWSPDGRKIIFGKMPFGAGLQIFDVKTEKTIDLIDLGKDPAWSPGDGKWIAFVKGTMNWDNTEVWIIEATGKNPRRIGEGGWPSWSSDGKTLFFRSNEQQKLLAIQPDGTAAAASEICEMPWSHFPIVSPDGTLISYIDNDELHVINRETKKETIAAPLPAKCLWFSSWSPEKNKIGLGTLFGNRGSHGLWIFNLETRKYTRILPGPYTVPAWSSDGSKIAFDLRDGDRYEVWMVETKNLDLGR